MLAPRSRRIALVLFAALVLAASALPARSQNGASRPRRVEGAPGQSTNSSGDLELRSDLVTLDVSVTDASGKAVTGLAPKDFRVLENGVPQKIEHFQLTGDPYTLLLVVDLSGSTASQVDALRATARQFVRGLGPEDKLALVGFSREIEILGDPTSDRSELERQIASLASSVTAAGSRAPRFSDKTGTSFYDAVYLACVESPLAQMPATGRRAVVLLSDCVDSSSAYGFGDIVEQVERSGISVYTLDFDTQSFSDRLLTETRADGGRVNFSPSQLDRFYDTYYPDSPDRGRDPRSLTTLERLEVNRGLYEIARGEAKRLSERTGGLLYPVATLADLPGAYAAVAAELHTRYSIDYYPINNTHDGKWRPIRVEVVGHPGAKVVTRPGYWAPRG